MHYPQLIKVIRQGSRAIGVQIDGDDFPYQVDGIDTAVEREGVPGITITLLAERVEIVNDVKQFRPS
uniref:hypothetical protein n=1 Tax=Pseudonocardia sp. CA-138482 TaxID=3240023 RepID=UPI003F494CCE